MSWTSPRTWTTSEVVTAAIMNQHLRDNLLQTAPAILTVAGDMPYASAANTLSRLAIGATNALLSIAAGIPAWVTGLAASIITSGQLALARGGTNADLSATGSATAVLAQAADHSISVRALVAADLPIAYVEGTWTPTILLGTTPVTSYLSRTGAYTEIGRMVTAYCYVQVNAVGAGTGALHIGGLPLASAAGIGHSAAAVYATGLTGITSGSIPGLLVAGSQQINLYYFENTVVAALTQAHIVAATTEFSVEISYFV